MADVRGPHDSGKSTAEGIGQHRLGPHVVGQRVVVRRVVRGETGPTGGPAFTDLLGTCLAWADGVCRVQPEDGPAVSIAVADIVSGKPVPPRPSHRLRVSAREAELHTATLWPAVERVALGEWQLRCDPAPTGRVLKRANSCLAMGDPGQPVPSALDTVRSFYAERGRQPLVQVESGSAVEDEVLAAGWTAVPQGESELWLASVAVVRRSLGAVPDRVELEISGPRAVASVGDACDPLAEGRAAVDGDWIGLHGLLVDPTHRRRGLGRTVVAELLEWGAEQGALTAWLHVETDNDAALAFWEGLGVLPHHGCRYYVAG
ncbi:GNAT family N-acetyltransferase [Nocardioides caeni]|uniref:GNAT family N-acetyltransferase n=1 Tax=Nocardioides caeni TaxID=574700 RepID=A0A4S8NMP4_9ACTN|nr:GNAT family N-acetyltransferase [Nocardioides caeni]THV17855.1 GNAT family N-acetyltransferase [Nocardioides caeni]